MLVKELEQYVLVDNIYKVGINKTEREIITCVLESLDQDSKHSFVTTLFNLEKNHDKLPELVEWLNTEMFTREKPWI